MRDRTSARTACTIAASCLVLAALTATCGGESSAPTGDDGGEAGGGADATADREYDAADALTDPTQEQNAIPDAAPDVDGGGVCSSCESCLQAHCAQEVSACKAQDPCATYWRDYDACICPEAGACDLSCAGQCGVSSTLEVSQTWTAHQVVTCSAANGCPCGLQ